MEPLASWAMYAIAPVWLRNPGGPEGLEHRDLPKELPVIAVASSGNASARIAAELGDGLFATEPKPQIINAYTAASGGGPKYGEIPVAFARTPEQAAQAVLEKSRWFITGWKVLSELPNPVNFDAASTTVREEDVLKEFACGPDAERYAEVVQQYLDAGFDELVLQNAGPDPDGFLDFCQSELLPRLRTNHAAARS